MDSIRIFIASPGDVAEERDIVSLVVVPELRRTFGDKATFPTERRMDIEALRWETNSWPDVGVDAQDVINRQIGEFDILIGIMWKRFGTPTHRAESGTAEEFQRAFDLYAQNGSKPKIMFYFRRTPFYATSSLEWEQFRKVLGFRQRLNKLGVIFSEYEKPIEFERSVREHLTRQLFRLHQAEPRPTAEKLKSAEEIERIRRKSLRLFIGYAREDLPRVMGIYNKLKAYGFDPWLDVADILPGERWVDRAHAEIQSAEVVLLVLSANAVPEKGSLKPEIRAVVDQVLDVRERRIYRIPLRLEPVELPPGVHNFQYIDYFADNGEGRLIWHLDKIISSRGG